jgi:uncharacterized membrane protein HdeD (DUF308 family)
MRRLHDHWQSVFWRGAFALLFGLATLTWPVITLSTLMILFGAFALVDGALAFATAMREHPRTRWSIALLIEGATGASLGLIALFNPGIALSFVITLLCIWAVLTGALEIAAATTLEGSVRHAMILGGAASVVAGVLFIARPIVAALTIAAILGIYAALSGLLLLTVAWRLRRNERHATRGGYGR